MSIYSLTIVDMLTGKQNKRCQYLPPVGDDMRMLDLRDQILVSEGGAFE
jgi:hypothetical protein